MDERPGTEVTAVAGRSPELRATAVPVPVPVPGPLLDGRYRLGPVLARGGMSTVHRATDTRLDRPVAVKVMDPRLAADPVFRACLLYTSPSPRDGLLSRMPSSA